MTLNNGTAKRTFQARIENYPSLCEWLESALTEISAPLKSMQQILIASDEVFTNIVSYAYPGTEGSVDVSLSYDSAAQMFSLTFCDCGIPFDPTGQNRQTDATTPLHERKIGGLGIMVVKKMMDAVEYQFADGCNILTLKKSLAFPPKEVK